MTQQNKTFTAQVTQSVSLDYLLYLPPDYDSQDSWPLIMFLHGYGERGDDLELLKKTGLPSNIAVGEDFPFIIASPQCPDTTAWPDQVTALNALLDHLIVNLNVDTDRIYLTGLSMGGYGTYYFANSYPERFAAIAPICGGAGWWMWGYLSMIPIWIFHGDADQAVSVSESERAYERIQAAGGDVQLTIYPGVGHDSWTETYANPKLYDWFLSHSLKDR